MGLFDKVKETSKKAGQAVNEEYKKQQQKAAEINELRGKRLVSVGAEYCGGYGEYKKSKGNITFFQKRTEYKVTLNSANSFSISNSNINNIAVEGRHEVNRRVTVTRMLAVGLFAFAIKKKKEEKEAFITLLLDDGQEAVFRVEGKSPLELKSKLSSAISQVKQASMPQTKTNDGQNVADELSKLADLKDRNIISEEEFDKQKNKLLS
jgi:hypothetical protein